jgi:Na+/H+ antiporter NhaD/arsenite permease-like protein
MRLVRAIAAFIPFGGALGFTFVALAFVPLLGSFITEPAAMTLAALILRDKLYSAGVSDRLKYAALGTLFVNVSIGGTLTPFAAPPVLMVAGKWGWDTWFMLATFGWKAALAVVVNSLALCWWFRRELGRLNDRVEERGKPMPPLVMAIHLAFLATIVVFSHRPAVFLAVLVAFLGFVSAYRRHQGPLMLREGLLVAVFLGGLVVLGGQQRWWLEPLLSGMDANTVYFGATVLTAVTDNAALTYLGSLVEGLSEDFRYSLVAGAVTGGGLTVIANAPNPAGFAILREHFAEGAIRPLGLFVAALAPTVVAILAFRLT